MIYAEMGGIHDRNTHRGILEIQGMVHIPFLNVFFLHIMGKSIQQTMKKPFQCGCFRWKSSTCQLPNAIRIILYHISSFLDLTQTA